MNGSRHNLPINPSSRHITLTFLKMFYRVSFFSSGLIQNKLNRWYQYIWQWAGNEQLNLVKHVKSVWRTGEQKMMPALLSSEAAVDLKVERVVRLSDGRCFDGTLYGGTSHCMNRWLLTYIVKARKVQYKCNPFLPFIFSSCLNDSAHLRLLFPLLLLQKQGGGM